MAASTSRGLFGDAITVTLPADVIDVSRLRQVPDTQEVFLYPKSGISIIVEILQSVKPENLLEAAKAHFNSLAHDNSSEKNDILEVEQLCQDASHQTAAPVVLYGTQAVPKFNSPIPDRIRILLALYRVQSHHIDLVMTMNVPMEAHDGGAVGETDWASAKDAFLTAARSLQIIDYGLFV